MKEWINERGKIIETECKCGQSLAKYKKVGKGKLQKMYLDMIIIDRAGIFPEKLATGQEIYCPNCYKKVATIQLIHGRPAAKINHGAVKPIKT